ncbi:putative G-protein coupled receptor 139 [Mustelus asterias]
MHFPPRGPIYATYYTALAGIAVPVNLVAIVILSRGKCGLSRCITWYLVSMAVTDLLVILTAVILNRIPAIFFPGSFLSITPVCSFSIALIYASRDGSVWSTVAFTVDRFVAICCLKLKTKYCVRKMAAVIIGTVCSLGCLKSVPWYFIHEPIHILAASRARRRLRCHSNAEDQSDPEMESRRKSIILLFAISGTFILLWMTYVVQFLYERLTNNYQILGFTDPKFILQESANMLQLLSSCTNTFIYAVTQRKFREELKNLVKRPLSRLVKLIQQ